MDATDEDKDIWVQKSSATLLKDFEDGIGPFVWDRHVPEKKVIREKVELAELNRLVSLLEPFQELPQLLDSHLNKLVPFISNAFLTSLDTKRPSVAVESFSTEPLSTAIAKLLYTFCKIRGYKVIVCFFSTETRHLEPLLDAIQGADLEDTIPWTWEERYITLLWLSQLLLAPFNLSTISSEMEELPAPVPGFTFPSYVTNVPSIVSRTIALCSKYLSSSGKERDAAKTLLLRLAVRRDMKERNIFRALVEWAIQRLNSAFVDNGQQKSPYEYIGTLSFLTGLLAAEVKTIDMDPYIDTITKYLMNKDIQKIVSLSIVPHKLFLKTFRYLSVIFLHQQHTMEEIAGFVQASAEYFMTALSNVATPVRLSASKALSALVLDLIPIQRDWASICIDEVIQALRANLNNVKKHQRNTHIKFANVNASEWHGLILTLSQLIYRRVTLTAQFHEIVPLLIKGLSFEQRSSSGSSLGTNVRDASCYGIWSLARGYSTTELQSLISIQSLATQLVVSATLDPAGNIRRGSSAALQELIGRHPNTIDGSLSLVQVVDYHAVALRSKAISDIALSAAQLSPLYSDGILYALLGWQGLGDALPASRRLAAASFGNILITVATPDTQIIFFEVLRDCLTHLAPREEDRRHGLILCVASILENGISLYIDESSPRDPFLMIRELVSLAIQQVKHSTRRQELTAEAISTLIVAAASLQLNFKGANPLLKEETRYELEDVLIGWSQREEVEVINSVSDAVSALVQLAHTDEARQVNIVTRWLQLMVPKSSGMGHYKASIATVFKCFNTVPVLHFSLIEAIHERWRDSPDPAIRATILDHLSSSSVIHTHPNCFADIISEGLDDYTTDARGDVGSWVRVKAVQACGLVWADLHSHPESRELFMGLYGKGLRLAAEKLDKVRSSAQSAIAVLLDPQNAMFKAYSHASEEYFRFLLEMQKGNSMLQGLHYRAGFWREMFEGFVAAADTGSEGLIMASRKALVGFCEYGKKNVNLNLVVDVVINLAREHIGNDRILIPALEVLAFLFDMQIAQHADTDFKALRLLLNKAIYKSTNIRKCEVAVRLYGSMSEFDPKCVDTLTKLVLHRYPNVRKAAVDTLFITQGVGLGVNWLKAGKEELVVLRKELGIENEL